MMLFLVMQLIEHLSVYFEDNSKSVHEKYVSSLCSECTIIASSTCCADLCDKGYVINCFKPGNSPSLAHDEGVP